MATNETSQHSVHPTGGSLRVFRQVAWLGVGSLKVALSHPAHQRVTQAVRQLTGHSMSIKKLVTLLLVIYSAVLVGCNSIQSDSPEERSKADLISEKSTEELIQILEHAEDVHDPSFGLFLAVVDELGKRGQSASEAAPALAKAITYRRRDSGVAGKALIPMGQSAANAIPTLVQNLGNEREDVRLYSVFSLGFIGKPAECSVPKLGTLLWDEDSGVRSAAAIAIEAITNVDLVWEDEELDPKTYGSVVLDDPIGSVTEKAKAWWQETGINMKWSTDNCAPIQ
jgi:hypothetical protein